MANNGFFMRDAYLTRTSKLTDEELGRLFRACMVYHATGEIMELEGREDIAFDFIREDIDEQTRAYEAKCETNRRNRNGTTVNDRQRPSTTDDDPQPDPTAVHKVKVKVKEKVKEISSSSFTDDEDAHRVQAEHDQILSAAENAGFPRNDAVRAKLLDAYTKHGLQKVLAGIEQCAIHSASNVAYLEAVLKGKPKGETGRPLRTVTAQQYSQRDYSGYEQTQDETMDAITQFLRQSG